MAPLTRENGDTILAMDALLACVAGETTKMNTTHNLPATSSFQT
jgi:hypothetical protein